MLLDVLGLLFFKVLATAQLIFLRLLPAAMQGLPQGRLLAYYPANRSTHVIAYGFFYSNGVALSKDESYVALAETDQLRVLK